MQSGRRWAVEGPSLGRVEIRELTLADEAAATTAAASMGDWEFLFQDPGQSWSDHLAEIAELAAGRVPEGWVRATFLVAVEDGEILGRVSIRHELNEHLRAVGGHIGYGVVPSARGRGVAGALLRHGLDLLADEGLDRALLTCDEDNLASRRVIERAGGILDPDRPAIDSADGAKLRFWVPTH